MLNSLDIARCSPISYSRDFIRVNTQFTRTNHMSKILDTGTSKLTFATFCLEFVFAKFVKYLAKVYLVFIASSTIHKYIVQVY